MPLPGKHSCVFNPLVATASKATQIRDHNGKKYDVLMQRDDAGKMKEHSYHYPTGEWSAEEAKNHCESHGGKFESAAPETQNAMLNEIAVIDGKVPDWIEILRTGWWPGPPAAQHITPDMLASALGAWRRTGIDLVIDYQHASTVAPLGGARAPAAGWIQGVELRNNGTELWGKVLWTAEAASAISRREYRYLSPALLYDQPDRVTGRPASLQIHSVALTNVPRMTELQALNQAAGMAGGPAAPEQGGDQMTLLEMLCKVLGLKPEEVTSKLGLNSAEDGPIAATIAATAGVAKESAAKVAALEVQVAALNARPVCQAVANALGIGPNPDLTAVNAAILKIKAPTSAGPLATRTALGLKPDDDDQAVLNAISALSASKRKSDAEELVDQAVKAGKVPPAQREFYLRAALADFAATQAVINSMTALTSGGMGDRKAGGSGSGGPNLDEVEGILCRQLGIKPEDYAAARG